VVTISIVSHGHNHLLPKLVQTLAETPSVEKILLTFNIPGKDFEFENGTDDKISIINNKDPKGFGSNHNQAFTYCKTKFFCILNPDVEFDTDPFPVLLRCLNSEYSIVSPVILNANGDVEDHARKFPTLIGLVLKLLRIDYGTYIHGKSLRTYSPDWIAGMFMLLKSDSYREVGGLHERYFLYYEDVDICLRFRRIGKKVRVCDKTSVTHKAHRDSHKKFKFFILHLKSLIVYFSRNPLHLIKRKF